MEIVTKVGCPPSGPPATDPTSSPVYRGGGEILFPTTIAGLKFCYLIDVGTTIAGGKLTSWEDQSPNKAAITPSGTGPTYTADDGDGLPALTAAGELKRNLPTGVDLTANEYTLIGVAQKTGTAGSLIRLKEDADNDEHQIFALGGTSGRSLVQTATASASRDSSGFAASTYVVFVTYKYNSGGNHAFQAGAVAEANAGYPAGSMAAVDKLILMPDASWKARAFLWYDTSLRGTANITALSAWLAARYNATDLA